MGYEAPTKSSARKSFGGVNYNQRADHVPLGSTTQPEQYNNTQHGKSHYGSVNYLEDDHVPLGSQQTTEQNTQRQSIKKVNKYFKNQA